MNRSETAQVLTKIAAYDARTIGDGDVLAWHESIGHLDFDRVMNVIPKWFADADNAGRRIMPGHIHGMCDRIRRGLAEREHTARVTGHDIDAEQLAAAKRAAVTRCQWCDHEGWISGRQTGDDGITRDAAIRCDHMPDAQLPIGFTPDPIDHGPRRPHRPAINDPQIGLPIGADGEPVWAAYEVHNAIDHPCPTCGAPPREGCINTLSGTDRIIPCLTRLKTGHQHTTHA